MLKKICLIALLLVCTVSISMAYGTSYIYNREGYLVIGTCSPNASNVSREYHSRKNQESTALHIRKSGHWSTLRPGYYILVYAVTPTHELAIGIAEQLKARGIDVYIKHSGKFTGGACTPPSGYFVIGLCTTNESEAQREVYDRRDNRVCDVSYMISNEYNGLNPGYYCVFYGAFKSREEAISYSDYLNAIGISTYVKYGQWRG